ncbi:hypothetical protein ACQPYK_08705 [Streptosporangium sp. CA-135522]|uniref:hypothetical protein n=1 Tax=Streptosporangium sp. CA-135522 TaxID=3240072 RepID=UPI003D8C3391
MADLAASLLAEASWSGMLAAPTGRTWTISLPAGTPLLNANQRLHHAPKAKLTAAIREEARKATEEARVPALRCAHIFGIFCPPTKRRRDVGNLYPSFKAAIDGAVDAGMLPDDSDDYLLGPDMRIGETIRGGQLHLLVIELDPTGAAG